ncbi:hypothetical protein StoSoilB5_26600 [Arthrobacter sp. StoSoilB5]|nr:hypothetical protein StoSoilB5_26600 [Arthrobacter sp. StoSoilB5]
MRVCTGYVNDAPTVRHTEADFLGKDEGCGDIYLEGFVPHVKREFLKGLLFKDPGIVDQRMKLKFITNPANEVPRPGSICQIKLAHVYPVRAVEFPGFVEAGVVCCNNFPAKS